MDQDEYEAQQRFSKFSIQPEDLLLFLRLRRRTRVCIHLFKKLQKSAFPADFLNSTLGSLASTFKFRIKFIIDFKHVYV